MLKPKQDIAGARKSWRGAAHTLGERMSKVGRAQIMKGLVETMEPLLREWEASILGT